MTVEGAAEGGSRRRSVVVGIRLDGQSRELINWALVKVADPGDHVVAIHVSKDLGNAYISFNFGLKIQELR